MLRTVSEIEPIPQRLMLPRAGSYELYEDDSERVVGLAELVRRVRRHRVTLSAIALIVAQLIWKGLFLNHFYFRQDDFHFTELGLQSRFNWKYLSYVGSGHLHPGVLAITWIMGRIALYNWGAAAALTLFMIAVASLAAWRLLRTLLGDRPAILIPLVLYLLTPLTLPDDGWWTSAIESLPLQAAIFLSLTAHVHYVRTGKFRHALAAACWLVVGLVFFEKAVVIPLLLFGVTAGFLVDGKLGTCFRHALRWFWKAWLLYFAIAAGYIALLVRTLASSTVSPALPGSAHSMLIFIGELLKDTLLPGILGGPWKWYPSSDPGYAYSAPSNLVAWIAVALVLLIIICSVLTRVRAWRAWAILGSWVLFADIVPVLIGRLKNPANAQVFGLETRYVADAVPVLAICVALAFWPVLRGGEQPADAGELAGRRRPAEFFDSAPWKIVSGCLMAAFVIGSLWSARSYQDSTSSAYARLYLANAKAALASVPAGTVIVNQYVPQYLMMTIFYGKYALQSEALGPLASGPGAAKLTWSQHPSGTIGRLMIFAANGTLHPARIYGRARSLPLAKDRSCRYEHNDKAVIKFWYPSAAGTTALRLAYLAGPAAAGQALTVTFGSEVRSFAVQAGLHSAYLPVTGSVSQIKIQGPALPNVCLSDAQAGIYAASSQSAPASGLSPTG
jgi:hypothetical protein